MAFPVTPSISVVIPTYNRAATLGTAIRSVLAQDSPPDEIIVIDDGSTDGTDEILAEFGDAIQVLRKPNGGVSSARNAGVRVARSEWIAFLDSDDVWMHGKLALQRREIILHPDIVCHAMNTTIATSSGNQNLYALRGMEDGFRKRPFRERPLGDVLAWCFFTQSVVIRKDACLKAGLFPERMRINEDSYFMARVALEGAFMVSAEPGSEIRRNEDAQGGLSDLHREAPLESHEALRSMYENLLGDSRLQLHERQLVSRKLNGELLLLSALTRRFGPSRSRELAVESARILPTAEGVLKATLAYLGVWGVLHRCKNSVFSGGSRFRRSDQSTAR